MTKPATSATSSTEAQARWEAAVRVAIQGGQLSILGPFYQGNADFTGTEEITDSFKLPLWRIAPELSAGVVSPTGKWRGGLYVQGGPSWHGYNNPSTFNFNPLAIASCDNLYPDDPCAARDATNIYSETQVGGKGWFIGGGLYAQVASKLGLLGLRGGLERSSITMNTEKNNAEISEEQYDAGTGVHTPRNGMFYIDSTEDSDARTQPWAVTQIDYTALTLSPEVTISPRSWGRFGIVAGGTVLVNLGRTIHVNQVDFGDNSVSDWNIPLPANVTGGYGYGALRWLLGGQGARYNPNALPPVDDIVVPEPTTTWADTVKEKLSVKDGVIIDIKDTDGDGKIDTVIVDVSGLKITDDNSKRVAYIEIKKNPDVDDSGDPNFYIVKGYTMDGNAASGDLYNKEFPENGLEDYLTKLLTDILNLAEKDPDAAKLKRSGNFIINTPQKIEITSGEDIDLGWVRVMGAETLLEDTGYEIHLDNDRNQDKKVADGTLRDTDGYGDLQLTWEKLIGHTDFASIKDGTYTGYVKITPDDAEAIKVPIKFTIKPSFPTVTAVMANVPPGGSPYAYDPINVEITMSGPGKIKVTLPNGYSQEFDVTAAQIISGKYTASFAKGVKASRIAPAYRTNTADAVGYVSVTVVGSSAAEVSSSNTIKILKVSTRTGGGAKKPNPNAGR